jgi:hypothetical protein
MLKAAIKDLERGVRKLSKIKPETFELLCAKGAIRAEIRGLKKMNKH